MMKLLLVATMLCSAVAFAQEGAFQKIQTETQQVQDRLDKLRVCAVQARAETEGKGKDAEDTAYYACKDALHLPRLSAESLLFDPRQSE